jgi:hypothetical protein
MTGLLLPPLLPLLLSMLLRAAARTAAAVAATAAALHAAAASATIIRELNRVGRSRGSGIWSVSSAASQSCQQRRHCLQRHHRRQPREYPVEYRLYAYLSKSSLKASKETPLS